MAAHSSLEPADRELLQAPNIAVISTLREDGGILAVPTWVDVEGEHVVLNSERSRAWPTNLRERGTVTVTVVDRQNPMNYVSIGGRLAEETTEGAFDHGDRMAQKYLGRDTYPWHQEGDVRVILRIAPERITRRDP